MPTEWLGSELERTLLMSIEAASGAGKIGDLSITVTLVYPFLASS